jgi:hypothetical protein
MMPILIVFGGFMPSAVSTRPKISDGEGHLLGPVHLRLDDIHRAGARVLAAAIRADVVQRDERR